MKFVKSYRIFAFIIMVISLITLLFIIYTIQKLASREIELTRKIIKEQAIALFDTIVTFRYWSASHGGVYVKQTSGIEPNPYLKNGTIKTVNGETLILINPAWMSRQIFELFQSRGDDGHYYKITSPHPVNPKNAPDEFESEAFHYFEQNPKERYYFKFPGNNINVLYFMGLLRAEKPCLKCHENVKIGDIRGGIRISIPLETLRQKETYINSQSANLVLLICILVVFTGLLTAYLFYAIDKKRKEIEYINETLEYSIEKRTEKISALHNNENHLRKIMQTIASVNKEIIKINSLSELMMNAASIIAEYERFDECWIVEKEKNKYIIKYHSENASGLFGSLKTKDYSRFIHDFYPVMQAIDSGQSVLLRDILIDGNFKNWHTYFQGAGINSLACFPLKIRGFKKPHGAIVIFSTENSGLDNEETKMLEELSGDLGFATEIYYKQKDINHLRTEKIHNFEETILSFIRLVEERDSYTAGHSVRVANYCRVIGEAMGISKKDLQILEKASILHDLGKIATPDSILLRPGRLSPIEYDLVKLHVNSGYEVLSKINIYKELAEIIKYHHERHDGMGYPYGVGGENIPVLSRILIVADAFDAMTTDRVYHVRLTKERALKEIKEYSGKQFHPDVAGIAAEALREVKIPEIISQFPQTELEKKRFSYFFNDKLTDLYNEDYLFLLIQNQDKINNFSNICFISLKNFSRFNKKAGWDQGDEILIKFGSTLQKIFPKSLVFRVQGDDFIIITSDSPGICEQKIHQIQFLEQYDLSIGMQFKSISLGSPLILDKKILNQIFDL